MAAGAATRSPSAAFTCPNCCELSGDVGARRLLQDYPVQLVEVDDPGIHLDIDRPQDLLFH